MQKVTRIPEAAMVRKCFLCHGICKRFCSQCKKECRKRRCPCDNVFYCNKICQQLHWAVHKPACSLTHKMITTSRLVLSVEQMEELYQPLEEDLDGQDLRRTIYLCNQRPVAITVPRIPAAPQSLNVLCRLEIDEESGVGNVTAFKSSDRELTIFRGSEDTADMIFQELVSGTPESIVDAMMSLDSSSSSVGCGPS
jgi:hypothetical protein